MRALLGLLALTITVYSSFYKPVETPPTRERLQGPLTVADREQCQIACDCARGESTCIYPPINKSPCKAYYYRDGKCALLGESIYNKCTSSITEYVLSDPASLNNADATNPGEPVITTTQTSTAAADPETTTITKTTTKTTEPETTPTTKTTTKTTEPETTSTTQTATTTTEPETTSTTQTTTTTTEPETTSTTHTTTTTTEPETTSTTQTTTTTTEPETTSTTQTTSTTTEPETTTTTEATISSTEPTTTTAETTTEGPPDAGQFLIKSIGATIDWRMNFKYTISIPKGSPLITDHTHWETIQTIDIYAWPRCEVTIVALEGPNITVMGGEYTKVETNQAISGIKDAFGSCLN